MAARRYLWMFGSLFLGGILIAEYAYADCGGGFPEVLDMQLIGVTYDGTPQLEPPEYRLVTGRLTMLKEWAFMVEIEQHVSAPPTLQDRRIFDAK